MAGLLDFTGANIFANATDLVIALLRPLEGEVPNLKVRSIIEGNFSTPYVLARATAGAWANDSFHDEDRRFARRSILDIQTFTKGVDGDTAGAALSELIWQRLYQAFADQEVVPGIGSIGRLRTSQPAHRVADWATSTGVNQYANLNKGYHRYQATYGIVHRPDRRNPLTAADLVALASLPE